MIYSLRSITWKPALYFESIILQMRKEQQSQVVSCLKSTQIAGCIVSVWLLISSLYFTLYEVSLEPLHSRQHSSLFSELLCYKFVSLNTITSWNIGVFSNSLSSLSLDLDITKAWPCITEVMPLGVIRAKGGCLFSTVITAYPGEWAAYVSYHELLIWTSLWKKNFPANVHAKWVTVSLTILTS